MKISRRNAIGILASTTALQRRGAAQQSNVAGEPVSLNWLDGAPPALETGVSWGVPWPRGAVRKDQSFALTSAEGKPLPLQNWPLAYWPDGSIKWTGFATVAGASAAALKLSAGKADVMAGAPAVKMSENSQAIDIDTGRLQCRIPRQGNFFIDSMSIEGRTVARQARLLCTLEDRSQLDKSRSLSFEDFVSQIRKVTVEQAGPVRAVCRSPRRCAQA